MDDGFGGEFKTVVGLNELTMITSFIATGLTKGGIYKFRCRVKNNIGWSQWSSPDTLIRAAMVP